MKSRGEIKAKPNKLLVTCVTISEPIKYVQLELKEIKEIKWFLFEDCIIVHVENPNESKKKKRIQPKSHTLHTKFIPSRS